MGQTLQKIQTLALKHIAEKNNLKKIEPAGWVADRIPSTGGIIYKSSAVKKDQPNGPIYSIIIDEEGNVVDLKDLKRKEKVDFFPPFPRPGTEDVNPEIKFTSFTKGDASKALVTISPSVNNLHLTPGQVFTEDIHVGIPAVPAPLFDVYFLADTTGSMGNIISAVKTGATNIMNTLHVSYPNMAFGVGNYKDFNNYDTYCFKHQQPCSTTVGLAQTSINAWNADGGVDGPEGQMFALHQIATIPGIWRPGAHKILVWFGDAPGHDPICSGLPGVPTSITEAITTAALVTGDIRVLAISTNTGYLLGLDDNATPDAYDYPCPNAGNPGQGTRIANATGGAYSAGVNAATISSTIISMITAATNLFNNVNLIASGGTAPFVTAITPSGGYGPVSGSEAHDYVFQVTFTGPPCKETDQIYNGTIVVIADGKVAAQKKVTLTVLACARWSYGVKFLCGYIKEAPPGVVPLTSLATLRPGIYATEVNILNYYQHTITVHKYLYPLMRKTEAIGREPHYVKRNVEDVINLPGRTATFDDCFRLHELLHDLPVADEPLSFGFLEIVSPVELNVTAVYTANDLRGISLALEVIQVEGKKIKE
jgi:hypothetical protein